MTDLLNSGKMKHINIPKWRKHKLDENKIHALLYLLEKNIYFITNALHKSHLHYYNIKYYI